jgi:hypothetical protein
MNYANSHRDGHAVCAQHLRSRAPAFGGSEEEKFTTVISLLRDLCRDPEFRQAVEASLE